MQAEILIKGKVLMISCAEWHEICTRYGGLMGVEKALLGPKR